MTDSSLNTSFARSRADRADQLVTVISGWASLIALIFGLHRWVWVGDIDMAARAGLILGVGLFVMWIWGYGPILWQRAGTWKSRGGLNTFVIALALIASVIIVNTLVRRRFPARIDLTENKRHSLAPRTVEILKSLQRPVEATVFIPAGRNAGRAVDLCRMYADASTSFRWTRVDPLTDQAALLRLRPKLDRTSLEGAVLQYGDKREDLTTFTEKDLTGAILKLTRETSRKILFLTGHGELTPDGGAAEGAEIQLLARLLRDVGWTLETVSLYGKNAPQLDPATTAVLVIAGPQRDLAAEERKRVSDYINKGGRVLLLVDARGPAQEAFLKEWGVQSGGDLVLGADQEGGLVVVEASETAHEAVRAARRVVMEPARALKAASPAPSGISVQELLSSHASSRVVSNYRPNQPVDLAAAKPGPAGVVVMAEKTIGSGDQARTGKLIVVGDSSWATDRWTNLPFFNDALANSLVNYLGEEEALVAIPPKDENTEQAFLTPSQARTLLLVHFLDFPLLALILAIGVYLKRR